jgi:hypothetical protein
LEREKICKNIKQTLSINNKFITHKC